jgi:hypothetical protein
MLSAAAVVVCALGLLGRSPKDTFPIRFMDQPPPGASRNVEAFVTRNPDIIVLITSTAIFQDAQRAVDPNRNIDSFRKIASIIVHEEWHLRHGDDERAAYEAQIVTLLALGATSNVISSVRASMLAVVNAQKRARKPELIARLP